MCKKIAFFNHKGGVSKTTSAYHIGWKLTDLRKRVLLIDADSQCNLSLTALGEEAFESHYQNNPENNLKELLKPAFKALPKLIEPSEALKVRENSSLFLIPGSFEITEYDVSLGMSFSLNSTLSTLINLPGSFGYLIDKYVEKYNIDYVIIDMNPSLSAVNQALLLTSDYFIIPSACDFFSMQAFRSIKNIIPQWENWAKQARTIFNESSYPLNSNTPKLLGVIMQRFNIRNGKPTQATQSVIDDIFTFIDDNVVPALNQVGCILPNHNLKLGSISDFNTLNTLYHKFGIPIFKITDEHMRENGWRGSVLDANRDSITRFDSIYTEITENIIANAV